MKAVSRDMEKVSIGDVDLSGKKVLVRVDFNVPIKEGEVADNTRIVECLPTIREVLNKGACFLASHLGRPKGAIDNKYSLKIIQNELERLLDREVIFIPDIISYKAGSVKTGELYLYENVRFYSGEESDDSKFARMLADSKEVFVNEAFSASHRKHASIHSAGLAIDTRCAGYLLNKELKNLKVLLKSPERPFVLILGGAKVRDKIPLIKNMIEKVDSILIGGAAAYTFLAVQGVKTGKAPVDKEMLQDAKEILELAKNKGVEVVLPCDAVISRTLKSGAVTSVVNEIPDDYHAGDIGPKTIELFEERLKPAKTVFWNGPLGIYEIEEFSYGSRDIADTLSGMDAFTIAGGGDVVAAINHYNLKNRFKHVSTGGGACLELLSGQELPGLSIIPDK